MLEQPVHYESLRDDWYRGNQLMPRLFRNIIQKGRPIKFINFPRQWIPVFEYFGIAWCDCTPPNVYVPIISDISDAQLLKYCRRARETGTLRNLVESVVTLDPILADFLYVIDNTCDVHPSPPTYSCTLRITNWQSYGRPEVKELITSAELVRSCKPIAVVLPCARKRPYNLSRTHRRIWRELESLNLDAQAVHQVVITSLAVLPEELWHHPTVMHYDTGVPDIYRTLRLARKFFTLNRYERVVDCLDFPPYSDVLSILETENLIPRVERGCKRRGRQF